MRRARKPAPPVRVVVTLRGLMEREQLAALKAMMLAAKAALPKGVAFTVRTGKAVRT